MVTETRYDDDYKANHLRGFILIRYYRKLANYISVDSDPFAPPKIFQPHGFKKHVDRFIVAIPQKLELVSQFGVEQGNKE